MALKKQFRFPARSRLKILFRKGIRRSTPLFSVVYQKNYQIGNFRLMVLTSKKLDKRAVVRNRVKRKIISLVVQIHLKEQIKNYDIIIIPKKEILNKNNREIQLELLKNFKDLDLLQNAQKDNS